MLSHSPDRLRRAWRLVTTGRVKATGGRTFQVAGNAETVYAVDLDGDPCCYCLDSYYHGAAHQCKHLLAARLASQDPSLLLALISLMTFTEP